MARSEARISVDIWDDPDFLALTRSAQGTFVFLLSQRDLSHAGVLALRERRWACSAAGMTAADVIRDLDELANARFVIVDDVAEELLIRSFIRRDKVYRQPNVLLSAADSIALISSQTIRAALVVELRRVAGLEDCGERSAEIVDRMLKELGNPSPNPSPNPSGRASGDGDDGVAEPASNASMHRQTFRDSPAMRESDETNGGSGQSDETAGRKGPRNPSPKATRGAPGERGMVTAVSTASPPPSPPSPSTAVPSKTAAPRATDAPDGAVPRDTQRSKRITDAYSDAVQRMCNWNAINKIVLTAIRAAKYADDDIRAALLRLADNGRSVTTEALRLELEGRRNHGNRTSAGKTAWTNYDDPDRYDKPLFRTEPA